MPGQGAAAHGRAGLVVAVVAATAVIALWPSLASLQDIWQEVHDYRHGYLLAAIAAVWFGVALRRLAPGPLRPSLAGSGLLGAVLCAWLVALNANSLMVHQLLLPAAIWLAVLAAAGWRTARRVLAPIAFLYFATPIWDYLLPALQWLSITATEAALRVLGVRAEVREYTVTIPEGSFQIIEGCSGKRYFMVTLALAMLAASASGLRPRQFIGFMAIAGSLALLANWIRIVIVIYAGHVTDMQHHFVAVEHKTLGNVVFVVLLAAIVLLARRLAPAPQAVQRAPEDRAVATLRDPVGSAWRPVVLPLALLASVLTLAQVRAHAAGPVATLGSLPIAAGKWQGPLPPQVLWAPEYVGPDAERRAAYSSASGSVEVYVNVYGEQRQGRELVYYGNTLLAPGAWSRVWQPANGRLASSQASRLSAFEARNGDGTRWLIAYTFEVGGWATGSQTIAQLAYGLQSMLRPAPAGVVALASPCAENCEAARALVTSFWDDMWAPVLAIVPDEGRDPLGDAQ